MSILYRVSYKVEEYRYFLFLVFHLKLYVFVKIFGRI